MKLILILACMSFASMSFANTGLPMTVKDRLRILLWTEGLKEQSIQKQAQSGMPRLPEEIEKPLRKF